MKIEIEIDVPKGYKVTAYRIPKKGEKILRNGVQTVARDWKYTSAFILEEIEPILPVFYVNPRINLSKSPSNEKTKPYVPVDHSDADHSKPSLYININHSGDYGYFYLSEEVAKEYENPRNGYLTCEYKPAL